MERRKQSKEREEEQIKAKQDAIEEKQRRVKIYIIDTAQLESALQVGGHKNEHFSKYFTVW